MQMLLESLRHSTWPTRYFRVKPLIENRPRRISIGSTRKNLLSDSKAEPWPLLKVISLLWWQWVSKLDSSGVELKPESFHVLKPWRTSLLRVFKWELAETPVTQVWTFNNAPVCDQTQTRKYIGNLCFSRGPKRQHGRMKLRFMFVYSRITHTFGR